MSPSSISSGLPDFSNFPMTLAGIGGLGPWELMIVLAIVLVVFGAKRLPDVGSSMGEAIRNFKKTMQHKNDVKPRE